MAGRASAFAALGLAPGADAAAVEQAYTRLIKQHHPDREGGDSSRTAEINQAYRALRSGSAQANTLEFHTRSGRRGVLCLAGLLPCSSPAPPLADLSWEPGQACRSAPLCGQLQRTLRRPKRRPTPSTVPWAPSTAGFAMPFAFTEARTKWRLRS